MGKALCALWSPVEAEKEWLRAEDGGHGRDCLTHMQLLRNRPDVLVNALRDMGVTESGDEVADDE